jgi:3,4-dihydroxy 2-butanone 4-phosphate synthase/GTP cyclohydrolase II
MFSNINEALEEFKMGNPILVVDDESRENEGDIIFPADAATQEKLNLCAKEAKGLVCIAIDKGTADRLNLSPVNSNQKDSFHTAFHDSIDAVESFGITTGISAKERAITALQIANHSSRPEDFIKPGHLFPVVAKENGVLVRKGHTEAAVDLCHLTGHAPAAIICEVMDEDGNMMRRNGLFEMAKKKGLKIISIQQLIDYREAIENHVAIVSTSTMPTGIGMFDVAVFRNNLTGVEHMVVSMKNTEAVPLVRLHSECLTGDVFGSLRCDCQQQLNASLSAIAAHGHGYLVYLRGHEGRGIGIGNKIAAYALQEKGHNTYVANEMLGLPKDNRSFTDAIWILKRIGLSTIKLISNNPDKINALKEAGLDVEVLHLPVEKTPYNQQYLTDKINIGKHTIKMK